MHKDKTVWVDMDATIFDFDGAAIVDLPEADRVLRQNFYVIHDYAKELIPIIEARYNAPDFFDNLPLLPGVIEAWQTMLDHGYEPRILSTPLPSNPRSLEGKRESLKRHLVPHFGTKVIEDAVFSRDKWKYSGLALIDDRPSVTRGENGEVIANWEHILFGWSHLETVKDAGTPYRLLDWHDTGYLIRLLDELQEKRSIT